MLNREAVMSPKLGGSFGDILNQGTGSGLCPHTSVHWTWAALVKGHSWEEADPWVEGISWGEARLCAFCRKQILGTCRDKGPRNEGQALGCTPVHVPHQTTCVTLATMFTKSRELAPFK